MHTYTMNECVIRTSDALKYSYYPQDIARCYRNLGYYYVEENDLKTALALYIYSMEYETSPLAYAEIKFIQSKTDNMELPLNECIEIIAANAKQRAEKVNPDASYMGSQNDNGVPLKINAGGATVFVMNIRQFEKL